MDAAAVIGTENALPMAEEARPAAGPHPSMSDAFTADCPARTVLNHVSSRWGVLILAALQDGPMRFYVLRDRIGGISEKMLSQNLRVFVRDGLIAREVEPTVPPQVTYSLTPLGRELSVTLSGLVDWVTHRIDDILAAREQHDDRG
ncbi:winged helix-turn-helix transcriptional regulator [Streptomyces sp. cmx-18-6]|uniref:winged helix-turn-helix transcriptional regulator n=1 Tax=Streptomyces sp. cmx-18-6 TaxID=2790930 RepID=UPI0039818CD9